MNGPTSHSLYKYLKKATDSTEVGWNFVKFLVVDGKPVQRYGSKVSPKSIEKDILAYLEPNGSVDSGEDEL